MDTGERQQPHGSAVNTPLFRYGVTVAAVFGALVARWLLDPLLGDHLPYPTFFVSVVIAAWVGGVRPALLATVMGFVLSLYFFVPPRLSFVIPSGPHFVGLAMYFMVCLAFAGFGEAMRVARRRSAEQKERLRTTLASIGDAVITTDTAGRVTNLNAVAETLTGWTNAEAWGQPLDVVFNIVNEETCKAVENPAFRALREGVIVGLANHTILIAKDGTERPIDDSAAPIRCKVGEVVGCVLVFRDISERHLQEAELRSQERQFRTLAESIPQLAWMANPDGHIFWYNRRWYDYTGTTLEQMAGWGWQTVHDPDELPKVLERWKASIATGHPFDMVFPLKGKDNVFRPFLTRVEPVKDDRGRVVQWFGTNTDVEESERSRVALRERETFISGVFGSITDGFYAVCKDWRFTFANDEIVRRFGKGRAEIVGGHLWEMFPAAVGNEAHVNLHRAMADRVTVEYEVFYPPWQRWFLDKAFPTSDGGLAVYTRDITERRRVDERLRASEERLRLVVESATDYAIFTMDTEGIINGWNAGAARLFCYSEAEVVGQHDRILYTPEDAAQKIPEREMRKAGADGRAVNERWHARKDGSLFWGSGLVQPLRGGGGVVGFLKIMRDMTEQREYEERLRQSEERFAALVEQCPFGMYIVDDQFRIPSMNEGSQKGAFANVRPVIGRPFDEAMRVLWPEPVAAEVINRFRHTLDTGEP